MDSIRNAFEIIYSNNIFSLEINKKTGRWSLFKVRRNKNTLNKDRPIIINASWALSIQEKMITIPNDLKNKEISIDFSFNDIRITPYHGNLGSGIKVLATYTIKDEFLINMAWIFYNNRDFCTIETSFTNISNKIKKIDFLSPLMTRKSENSSIFIGEKPSDVRVFENGFTPLLEFLLRAYPADEEADSMNMIFLYNKEGKNGYIDNPEGLRDLDQKNLEKMNLKKRNVEKVREKKNIENEKEKKIDSIKTENLLIGVINKPENFCDIIMNDEEDEGLKYSFNNINRIGIPEFRAQVYFPFPKRFEPNDTLTTNVWMVRVDINSGFNALENYADVIREYNNIRVWPGPVPHGWNSWNNPNNDYPEYFYSTKITETAILDNMDLAIKYLKRFGLNYWQIDDGYTHSNIMTIDEIAEERFPNGMGYVANKIREKGLIPGIWINPFNIGKESKIYKEHKEDGWFPDPDPSFPIKDNWKSLDLTIPEVQNYLKKNLRKVVFEWGFELLKIDFTYLVMAPAEFNNKTMTAFEVQTLGYKLIREAVGPDIFIMGIGGPLGCHLGIVNAERVSLDTLPIWGEQHEIGINVNGVVSSFQTFARRYYMHNRLWINHLDCLSIRPSLTKDEYLCLFTAVALLGGIWKIGDKLLQMKPKEFEFYQKILPIYRKGAKPIDLFEKLRPEKLDLLVESPIEGLNDWHVIGLFNWGENKDIINNEMIPESDLNIEIFFKELISKNSYSKNNPTGKRNSEQNKQQVKQYHVFDFWNEKYLGVYKEKYSIKLKPHSTQCICLRPILMLNENEVSSLDSPQIISVNRHITQGLFTFKNIKWNSDNKQYHLELKCVPEFEYHLYIAIPKIFVKWKIDPKIINIYSESTNKILKDLNVNEIEKINCQEMDVQVKRIARVKTTNYEILKLTWKLPTIQNNMMESTKGEQIILKSDFQLSWIFSISINLIPK